MDFVGIEMSLDHIMDFGGITKGFMSMKIQSKLNL